MKYKKIDPDLLKNQLISQVIKIINYQQTLHTKRCNIKLKTLNNNY